MTLFLVSTSGQIWSIFGKSQSRQEYRTTAASSWSNSFSEVVLNRRFWLARQRTPPSQNQIQNGPSYGNLRWTLWKLEDFSQHFVAICSGPMKITPDNHCLPDQYIEFTRYQTTDAFAKFSYQGLQFRPDEGSAPAQQRITCDVKVCHEDDENSACKNGCYGI